MAFRDGAPPSPKRAKTGAGDGPSPHAGPPLQQAGGHALASNLPAFLAGLRGRTDAGDVRVAVHNVNGLYAASQRPALRAWLAAEDADVVCLQETKLDPKRMKDKDRDTIVTALGGYFRNECTDLAFWNRGSGGQAGVLTCVRASSAAARPELRPCGVGYGVGVRELDADAGRCIVVEFPAFYLVNVYVPHVGDPPRRMRERARWDAALRALLASQRAGDGGVATTLSAANSYTPPSGRQMRLSFGGGGGVASGSDGANGGGGGGGGVGAGGSGTGWGAGSIGRLSGTAKDVLVVGDLNVCHLNLDTSYLPEFRDRKACMADGERNSFCALLADGFRDVWRDANPGVAQYTFFLAPGGARSGGGWRLDYALVGAAGGGGGGRGGCGGCVGGAGGGAVGGSRPGAGGYGSRGSGARGGAGGDGGGDSDGGGDGAGGGGSGTSGGGGCPAPDSPLRPIPPGARALRDVTVEVRSTWAWPRNEHVPLLVTVRGLGAPTAGAAAAGAASAAAPAASTAAAATALSAAAYHDVSDDSGGH